MKANQNLKITFETHKNGSQLKIICERLIQNQFKAYLVGGCVRDRLLNREPQDLDIVTDATPTDLHKIFKRVIDVGVSFGVVLVVIEGHSFEVSTFRKDLEYSDGRHPQGVEFSDEKEDALRRDFTINSLFWDYKTQKIIDYVDGVKDLQKKIIKTVGDPYKRFSEDQLRILRALRFSTQLEFKIEPQTMNAIYSFDLKNISKERILAELKKVFLNSKSVISVLSFLCDLEQSELIAPLFNDINKNKKSEKGLDLVISLCLNELDKIDLEKENLNKEDLYIIQLLFFILKKVGNEESLILKSLPIKVQSVLEKWPLSKIEKTKILGLIKLFEKMSVQKNVEERVLDLSQNYFLNKVFIITFNQVFQILNQNKEFISLTSEALCSYEKIAKNGKLPEPQITGADLIKLGLKPGKDFSKVLKKRYLEQIRELIN